jgi:tryptophan halogenase
MEIPESLGARSTCSPDAGRLFQSDYDLFAEPSWIAVLLGQGIVPRGHDAAGRQLAGSRSRPAPATACRP